ncbi:hypothetical protein [Maribacter sp. LLG6340-A2]|uniref:hypothetical protein n=1 Tax=Maribacter sp. LLG6340-A2 TaxID=3160834 RepID=UPI0038684D9B
MRRQHYLLTLIILIIGCEKVDTSTEKQIDIIDEVLENEDIDISYIIENPIIYESVNFTLSIKNNELGISKIEAQIADEIVAQVEDGKELQINLNPDNFPAGDTMLTLKITDANGNITQHNYPISFHRVLLELHLKEDFFLPPQFVDFYFFASAIDGTLLASRKIDPISQNFKLTTPIDISLETPYSLTYVAIARDINNTYTSTNLFTIKDLTRNNLPLFSPKGILFYGAASRSEYSTNGFPDDDVINIGTVLPSYGYDVGYYSNTKAFIVDDIEMNFVDRDITNYYVPYHNLSQNDYAYIWLNKQDLSSDFVLDFDNLIRDGIESRIFDASYNDGKGDGRFGYLTILGYNNSQDFQDGIFHYLWQRNHVIDASFPTVNTIPYFLNTTFEKYSHVYQWEDYYTNRIGVPLESYNIPTWSFEYIQNGKEIDIIKNGDGHTSGKIFLNNLNDEAIINGKRTIYNWSYLFDSQNTEKIILPELPDDLKNSEFGSLHSSNSLLIERVLLNSYDGILSYPDFLDKIIKTNENILKVTPKVEAKFINRRGNQWVIESDKFFY